MVNQEVEKHMQLELRLQGYLQETAGTKKPKNYGLMDIPDKKQFSLMTSGYSKEKTALTILKDGPIIMTIRSRLNALWSASFTRYSLSRLSTR